MGSSMPISAAGSVKQRVARPGQGKSGGYRTVIAVSAGRSVRCFCLGFAEERSRSNVDTDDELEDLKGAGAGRSFGSRAMSEIAAAIAADELTEVEYGEAEDKR